MTTCPLKNSAGMTMIELTAAAAIVAILYMIGSTFIINVMRFMSINNARVEIQRDARTASSYIQENLKSAVSTNVQIQQMSGQPPYSQIVFVRLMRNGSPQTMSYYQMDRRLYARVGTEAPMMLSENLRSLLFAYPNTLDKKVIAVSMSFEKETYGGKTKTLQLAAEKVRLMN